MAIGFARLEFVQRSSGKNACAKSAYIGRNRVHFKGNEFAEAKTYDWSSKEPVAYQEILLPKHVNSSFLKSEVLWNTTETKENRSNSQTAMEAVLALPDDLEVSLEDKIELAKSFVQKNFIDRGLGAQLVIHPPENRIQHNPETGEIENLEHNWHAHILLTTRRFKENGEELEDKKARDLMPSIRNGKVILGPNWGIIWTEHQNHFFESKGMSLRVDPNGLVSQMHLGPVRLRGRALSILEKNEIQKELNIVEIQNPVKLLEKIAERKNIFSREDLTRLIHKFASPTEAKDLIDAVIAQKNVIQLFDRETGKLPLNPKTGEAEELYTTMEILLEEKRCLSRADKIQQKGAFEVNFYKCLDQFSSKLTSEQKIAFENILRGSRLNCIEGHAGTGKSHLLVALKNAYESEGYIARAFGPDSATAKVLKEKGFSKADNIYHFLFSANRFEKIQEKSNKQKYAKSSQLKRGHPHFAEQKNDKPIKEGLQIQKRKEVWLIDEATKLGNRPMQQILKFAEKYDAQIIFSGGSSQLLPVERGCLYDVFSNRYGSQKLENIQRQKDSFQREISKKIAKGEMASAIDRLFTSGSIIWVDSKEEKPNPTIQGFIEAAFGEKLEYSNDRTKAIEELMKKWVADREAFPSNSSIIIACSNQEVKAINEMVRTYRKEKGEVAKEEFNYETEFGNIFVSQGDTIEFSSNNKEIGITNGMQGTLVKASPEQFTVLVKNKGGKAREINVDPNKYASFKLGYATTYFRSQGRTIDRAYILHSVYTNKEMFYVGLTRHVNKAYMFVPKSNFHYLSYLKAQAAGFGEGYRKYLALNDYFKDKDINSYLNDLIHQVSQETSKFATSDFISKEDHQKLKKDLYIEDLKNSASSFSRLRGYSLSLWNQVSTRIENYRENKNQEKKEAEFFNPVIKKLEEKARIKEEAIYEPTAQEYRQAFVRSLILMKDKSPTTSPQVWKHLPADQQKLVSKYLERSGQAWRLYYMVEKEKEKNPSSLNDWQKACEERNALAYDLSKTIPKEAIYEILGEKYVETLKIQSSHYEKFTQNRENEISYSSQNHSAQLLKAERTAIKAVTKFFSPEQEKLLKNYQRMSKEASSLHALVQAEKENDSQNATHHTAWKVTCGKRNAAAYQLLKSTSPEVLSNILSQKSYEFLTEQAERHERLIKHNETRLENLDTQLKNNLEPLLYRLFPEGPIRKSRGEWRFGSKGSLVVTCQGEKGGIFYSFAEEKGGGPLQLVQMTLGLNAKQAIDWAKDFVGEAKEMVIPPNFKIKTQRVAKESEWISIKPDSNYPAPSLKNIPNCKLARYCKEETRYLYKNKEGELLFYAVRLIDKNGKKSVLPLSYGFEKGKGNEPQWAFKAFQSNQRPLYNLHLLQQNPSAKVIIVEGEKTADAANRLLNKHGMICLTWLGGVSATMRTDWSPLIGREVTIWPDNDQPGFKAANNICSELRKIGVDSLHIVDEKSLSKIFPLKWDLADPLPQGKENKLILDLLMCANEKSVNIQHLSFAIDSSNKEIELLRMREILWRVEERVRPQLEQSLKDKPQDINKEIIKETIGIYRTKNQLIDNLKNELKIDNYQIERLAFQTQLHKAQYGQNPVQSQLLEMKIIMQNSIALLPAYHSDNHLSKEIYALATDKTLSLLLRDQKGKAWDGVKEDFEKEFYKINQYAFQQHHLQQMTNQQSRTRGIDLSI